MFADVEKISIFAKSSNKHTDKNRKMQPIVNIRGSITHLPVGDSVRFEK